MSRTICQESGTEEWTEETKIPRLTGLTFQYELEFFVVLPLRIWKKCWRPLLPKCKHSESCRVMNLCNPITNYGLKIPDKNPPNQLIKGITVMANKIKVIYIPQSHRAIVLNTQQLEFYLDFFYILFLSKWTLCAIKKR